jgi:hypothetical protein
LISEVSAERDTPTRKIDPSVSLIELLMLLWSDFREEMLSEGDKLLACL